MNTNTTKNTINIGGLIRRPEFGTFLGLLVVFVFFVVFGSENFVKSIGFSRWLNMAMEVGIIALPVGLLMIAGELDLSVGAVLPASSLTMAIVTGHYDLPDALGIIMALGVGAMVGLVNGILVSRTKIPSLIITIGTMFGTMGLTLGITVMIAGSTGVFMTPSPFVKAILGQKYFGTFHIGILWWLGFAAISFYLLQKAPWGNWVYAIGGDRVSAVNAGIPVRRVTITLYLLSGIAAAFVGLEQVVTFQSAQVAAGQNFIFNAIMCVVIGGVLLTGGAGSILGIVLGTMTFSIVNQGIFFTQLDPNLGSIIIGSLLLIAVISNDGFRNLAIKYSTKTDTKPEPQSSEAKAC